MNMQRLILVSGRVAEHDHGGMVWHDEHEEMVADLQRQLADAIRERDQYKAACEMADALRPLGAVQVVEGGAAVLLDTSKGAA